MIYNFTINIADRNRNAKPIYKQFYLTADNDAAFYRRCLEQYRAQRDVIEILERIPDSSIDPNMKPEKRIGYQPPKAPVEIVPAVEDPRKDQIKQMVEKARGLGASELEAKKTEWLVVESQTPESDLAVALSAYKNVKLYYKRTGAKKNKVYVILCKNKLNESSGKRLSKSASKSCKGGKKKQGKKSTPKKSG